MKLRLDYYQIDNSPWQTFEDFINTEVGKTGEEILNSRHCRDIFQLLTLTLNRSSLFGISFISTVNIYWWPPHCIIPAVVDVIHLSIGWSLACNVRLPSYTFQPHSCRNHALIAPDQTAITINSINIKYQSVTQYLIVPYRCQTISIPEES